MSKIDTDEIRELLPDMTDSELEVQLREALDEIDRLREGPWEPKRRMWEKMIEQRTKEACFKAGWKWYVKFDTRRSTFGEAKEAFKQAIDSVGNQS